MLLYLALLTTPFYSSNYYTVPMAHARYLTYECRAGALGFGTIYA